jgi:glycosyltransferase involved in cell wall biosynthesis
VALWQLWRFFRRSRFDAVHSVTPKAGLLAGIAARLAGVPVRIHWFTGQVWVTRTGFMRRLLKAADRLIATNATHVLVDSHSQRDFLIDEGVVARDRAEVIAAGSICGVDARRFHPDAQARAAVRAELGVADVDKMILFLGRWNHDKGVLDLARAFAALAATHGQVHLVIVGPDEEGLAGEVRALCAASADRLHMVGFTREPERFMAAADIFCLPSYREGFGSVLLEAAAVGIPSVATRIYGITDAVVEGVTGLLVPPGDVAALTTAVARLVADDVLRMRLGAAAQVRARQDFSQEAVTAGLLGYYRSIPALGDTGAGERGEGDDQACL